MLRILAYHRIAELRDTPAVDVRTVSATPEGFWRQMRHLASFYQVVSMPEVLEAFEKGWRLPKRAVLITFDDAYADFAEIAWPILRQLGLPATMFVPTGYPKGSGEWPLEARGKQVASGEKGKEHPERAFWWDRLYQAFAAMSRTEIEVAGLGRLALGGAQGFEGLKVRRLEGWKRQSLRAVQNYVTTIPHSEAMRLVDGLCAELGLSCAQDGSVLSWEQLRELAREGLTLGAHTRTHPIMTQITRQQIREEVQGSLEDLQRETGKCLPIFCYPNGSHNDAVVSVLREQGVRLAFTTLGGINELGSTDPLRLHRTVIMPRTTPVIFCLRLLRWGIRLDAWRERKQRVVLTRGLPEYRTNQV